MRGVMQGVLMTSLMLLGACQSSVFACSQDSACDEVGTCEADGWCSFPDTDCPSGRRYGKLSGGGVADTCVPPGGDASTSTTSDDGTETDPPLPVTSSSDVTTEMVTSLTVGPEDDSTTVGPTATDDTTGCGPLDRESCSDGSTGDETDGSTTTAGDPFPCPGGLFDDFDDGTLAPQWLPFAVPETTHIMTEADGVLSWSLTANEESYLGVRRPFEGTLGRVRMAVPQMPTSEMGHSQVVLYVQGLTDPLYVVWSGTLVELRNGPERLPLPIAPYVELRLEPPNVVVASSADGVTFEDEGVSQIDGDLTELFIALYGQTWTVGPADSGAIDWVEACPQ